MLSFGNFFCIELTINASDSISAFVTRSMDVDFLLIEEILPKC